jgi:antitoxin YefM
MNILTFSEARANLKTVMDQVCQDHSPAVVTRINGEPVVILSLADYNSMQETMYLLSSTKNTNRLMESIAQLHRSKAKQCTSNRLVLGGRRIRQQKSDTKRVGQGDCEFLGGLHQIKATRSAGLFSTKHLAHAPIL